MKKTYRNDFKQEIFDKVSKHLLEQNEKALGKDFKCKYRSPEGLKCAAGCLIPDCDYDPKMEGRYVRNVIYFSNAGYNEDELELLAQLQEIHDSHEVHGWKMLLIETAKENELTCNF